DGHQDVAVTDSLGNLQLFLGHGLFSFTRSYSASGIDGTADLRAADLNEDGRLDVVAIGDRKADVLLGDGAGSFGSVRTFDAPGGTLGMGIVDLDGDGHLDVVVGGTVITIMRGDGQGNLGGYPTVDLAAQLVAAGDDPFSVAIGDFDEDGRPDISVANS